MAKSYTNVIWKMQIVSILISIITICSTYKYGIYSAALSYLLSVLYIGYAYWKKNKANYLYAGYVITLKDLR